MAAKKSSAKRKAAKKKSVTTPPPGANCPNSPKRFFDGVETWATQFAKWANGVETCFDERCATAEQRDKLVALCRKFSEWAKDAKTWADVVEACFQKEDCPEPPDHPKPPKPPF